MGKCILVVDESAGMLQMLSFALETEGYEVARAMDSQEGLETIQGKTVHMVITDQTMLDMDGIEFIPSIRENMACRFIPIIILTNGHCDNGFYDGKAAGATAWINKPFRPDQLCRIVKMLVG